MNNLPNTFIGEDSGFISYKSAFHSIALNVFGHNNANNEGVDPRLVGGVPFWSNYKSEELFPSIPFTHWKTTSNFN